MADEKAHLYTAWHSPFGMRAWAALLEKDIPFEYHEKEPCEKSEEWLKISPRGLVPVIQHKGKSVYESNIIIEYLDDAWPGKPRLMPSDPFDKAYVRMWADHVNNKITPPLYGMIVKQDAVEQDKDKQDALDGIAAYLAAMRGDGPWFMGEQFTLADIALGPFACLMFCYEYFRGFKVPENDERFARFHPWISAVKARKSWQMVIPSREKILEDWRPYAEGKRS